MAGQRSLPGLGLKGFWDLGDNTYKTGVDANMRTVSALVQPFIDSIRSTAPGSPADGDIHLATAIWGGASANDIVLRDDGNWIPITPGAGWKVFNRDTGVDMLFDGTNWITPGLPRFAFDATTSYALSDADLDGRTVLELSNGGGVTFTLTDGLTAMGPLTIINTGGGNIAFTEDTSSTLQSTFPNLKTQWGWATLIPKGADVFHLGGNLEAA